MSARTRPGEPLSSPRRFQLHSVHGVVDEFDTWEEAEVAFSFGIVTKMIPRGFFLSDRETGRSWLPGARHEWEDAQT